MANFHQFLKQTPLFSRIENGLDQNGWIFCKSASLVVEDRDEVRLELSKGNLADGVHDWLRDSLGAFRDAPPPARLHLSILMYIDDERRNLASISQTFKLKFGPFSAVSALTFTS